jgi:glycosyltransferase involved in cell wall biosynthesis
MNKEVSISEGNRKLGNVYNISLPPIKSCGSNLPCYRKCYARKAYRMYPSTRKAWDKNYELYNKDPGKYFNVLDNFLTEKKPSHFRLHVAGDFPDIQYLQKVVELVENHKDTKFLAFTKRFDLLNIVKSCPANLSIVLSAWPNFPMDKELQKKYPVAWMYDKKDKDNRIPKKDVIKCNSNCQTCNKNKGKVCWDLKKLGKDVVFHVH